MSNYAVTSVIGFHILDITPVGDTIISGVSIGPYGGTISLYRARLSDPVNCSGGSAFTILES